MQLDEDFCMAICILLGKFAVLLGNNKFQTIIQPYESLKPGKQSHVFQDSKTVFEFFMVKLWFILKLPS